MNLSKKEKIAVILLAITMLLMLISAIATLIHNKPEGYKFNIERVFK